MSDTKFTEGPWEVDNMTKVYCDDETGSIVADCGNFQFINRDLEEQISNAHLIAAAPDMYAMLELLRDDYDSCVIAESIDELLTRARGESPKPPTLSKVTNC